MILKCVTQTTGMSLTRYSVILVYPTYYHVTDLVGLTDSDCIRFKVSHYLLLSQLLLSLIKSNFYMCEYYVNLLV